ncbi:MAG: hypothetical protein ACTHN0_10585 [Aquihabitans sp.]
MSFLSLRRRRHVPLRAVAAVLLLGASLAGIAALSTPVAASPHAFTDPIFSADARGDIATIGNVATTCDPTYANDYWSAAESDAACNGARNGAGSITRWDGQPMIPVNNLFSMQPVDVDGDPSTFGSSSAVLRLPAGSTVLWAGLHWNGATHVPQGGNSNHGSTYGTDAPDPAAQFQVRFATPASGGYQALDAAPADGTTRDTWDPATATDTYGAFVDVTNLVKAGGSGRYTVADIQTCRGFSGCFGSWSLTVALANPSMPARNLNVWHGWQLTTPGENGGVQQFDVTGITPPPSGKVNARIGVVQADGDRGLGPDSLEISSPSHPAWTPFAVPDRPLAAGETDWFNSTVNTFGQRRPDSDANPNYLANLDQDIAIVQRDDIIGNEDSSVSFRVKTAGSESLYSQVIHSAVDLYEPEIGIAKTVDPAGPVKAGDEATWTLDVTNDGIDPIRRAAITDPLPEGLTYVPGSVRYVSGGPSTLLGTKTDAAGDDQVDWDAAKRTLTFRVGAGADGSTGGTMGIAPAADGSHQITISFRTKVDIAPGSTLTNTAHAHGEGRELDDPFGPLVTDADDPADLATDPESDLGITKTDGDAVVRHTGDRYTYGLTAANGGPSPATGVTLADELDPHIRFVDSDDGCTASGQAVTCPVGDLASGADASRTFVVEVVELPGPGKVIPNAATVTGDQPNPDCDDAHPDALCNQDDEETPQPSIDLGITKTDDDAVVTKVGDEYDYRFEIANAGPDDATGVTVSDALDPMIAFVASDQCTAEGQDVTCELGDLPAGTSVEAKVRVRVVTMPDPGTDISNTAAATALEPDPTCDDAHPDALCNEDDEHTPRPEEATTTTEGPVEDTTGAPAPGSPSTPVSTGPASSGFLPRTGTTVLGLVAAGTVVILLGATVLAARKRVAR